MRIECSARTAQIQTQRQNQMVLQTLRVVTQSSTELCETLAAEASGNDFLLLRWPQGHRAQAHPGAEDAATLAAMLTRIKKLEPRPGAQFPHSAPILRVPELSFSPGPDGWQVALNPEAQPQIALNDGLWARLRTAASAEQTAAWQRARHQAGALSGGRLSGARLSGGAGHARRRLRH